MDETEKQSTEQLDSSQRRSLRPAAPPAAVAGYTVQAFLGSGAYGEVWAGIDRKTGRSVAIKFYTRRSSVDLTLLAREVEKLAALAADRYVVQLLDVGWNAEPPHYVMDFLVGGSLEDLLASQPQLPVEKAVDLFKECAQGLMHLHGKGILHCDLKPGNILLDQDHKPRLADFGQARLSHEQTPALGTLFYMAPEQADLNAVPDARWDVYALGAILYRMLSGSPPYHDPAVLAELESARGIEERLAGYRAALARAPRPTAHRRVSRVDRMLAEIIDRCIAVDPERRFSSADSILAALRQREHAQARRPLMVVGLLGPLLLLIGMALFGQGVYRRAVTQTDEAVMAKTAESNRWAARLAARSAGEQIDSYFRAVEGLAADAGLEEIVRRVEADETLADLRRSIADPARNADSVLGSVRQQLIAHPQRVALQERLEALVGKSPFPDAASWFICDRWGNQMAAVFNEPSRGPTIARNFSYRSYFRDDWRDAAIAVGDAPQPPAEALDGRDHIVESHLSGVFQSQATATWKVAFSTPLWVDDQFAGIVALTTEMGDFIEFDDGAEQYAMMVDARPGGSYGVILEHPRLREGGRLNGDSSVSEYRIDLSRLMEGDPFLVDPLSAAEGTGSESARWVASFALVDRTDRERKAEAGGRRATGLAVVAVQDYRAVMRPVHRLEQQLGRLAVWATVFVTLVIGLLSFWLWRTFRLTRQRLAASLVPQTDSAGGGSAQTLALPR